MSKEKKSYYTRILHLIHSNCNEVHVHIPQGWIFTELQDLPGLSCSKLTTSLVNETYQTFYVKICLYFAEKNVRSFCSFAVKKLEFSQFFDRKNITAVDFVSTVRRNESSTNDLVNPF